MARSRDLTEAQIARLRQEFVGLQEDIENLQLSDNLLEGIEKFDNLLGSSSAKLVTLSEKIKDNEVAQDALAVAIVESNAARRAAEAIWTDESKNDEERNDAMVREAEAIDRVTAAKERKAQYEKETALLEKTRDQNIQSFLDTLEKEEETLEKAAKAQIKYAEAMALLKSGDIAGAKKKMMEAAEGVKTYKENVKEGEAEMNRFLNTTLGVSGGLAKLGGFVKRGKAGFEGMAGALKKTWKNKEILLNVGLKFLDVGMKMLKYQVEFLLKQDKVIAEFRKSTGAGREFNDMILGTEVALRQAGVELEEAAAAYRTLKNEVVGFTDLNKDQMVSLANTTALLAEMGFELGTQASITQTAMESMNMSVTEAEELLIDLTSTARTVGMDVDKMGQQFVASSDFLAGFGKKGAKVFEEMAIQAKSVGMEVTQLIDVMKGFQKFDDAARSVGRLNAILGGPFLNSIDMMNAAFEDPAEGIKMLRASLDQAGVAMEDLSRPEKMAFADALGMSVEDMTNMMGKSNEELEIHRLEQEELAEQARQTMDITMQLKKAFQGFYISLKPFLDDVIIPLVGKMASLAEAMGAFFATKAGMVAFFALFVGLMVTGIALVTAFALMNMAAATASMVGIPAAGAAGVLMGLGMAALATAGVAGAVTVAGGIGTATGVTGGFGGAPPDEGPDEYGSMAGAMAAGGSVRRGNIRRGRARGMANGGTAATPIEINEFGSERLIVPYGTYVTNAQDVKRSNELAEEIITELQGLRGDLTKTAPTGNGVQDVQLVVDDERFASKLFNKSGVGALS